MIAIHIAAVVAAHDCDAKYRLACELAAVLAKTEDIFDIVEFLEDCEVA